MRRRPTISATALAVGLLIGSAASAATIELSVDSAATLGGLSDISNGDIVNYDTVANTATLAFDEGLFSTPESVDAYDRLPNGHMVFSTFNSATLGSNSLLFQNGDLVQYDPVNDLATLIFSESLFTGNTNIDGVAVLANGHFLISTDTDAILGGLSFRDGDIVDYDPIGNIATLFFNEDLFGADQNVNAIDIDASGMLLLSISSTGGATLGGLSFGNGDLILYDPIGDTATLFFSEALFTGGNEDVDAVAFAFPIPEPGTASLLGLGLAGLGLAGRKRSARG